MVDDSELLRRYAESRSEPAFAELVQRHLSLVYHAALRRSGNDAHRAADVTQTVFTALARDAAKLSRHSMLTAWLHAATRNAAIDATRSELRRKNREQTAHIMQQISTTTAGPADWDRVRPVLDEVMDELGEHERAAVLLRFLEEQPFAVVGKKLAVSEDAARMRVDRALDKMRALLARRGIASTTAALAATLAHEASAATPPGLAASVTGSALAKAAAAGGGAAATTFSLFSAGKIIVGLIVAAAATTAGWLVEYQANAKLRDERDALHERLVATADQARSENSHATPADGSARDELTHAREEIAKLRDELQTTKEDSARNTASSGGIMSSLSAASPVPGIPSQLLMPVEGRYVALFNELKLTRDQLNVLNNLLGEKQRVLEETVDALLKQGLIPESNMPTIRRAVTDAQASVNAAIRSELGEDVYDRYSKYEQTLPQRNTVTQLAGSLRGSATPLTENQADRMIEILALTHEPEAGGGLGRLLDGNATYHSRISAQTINMAASVLSEPQLYALELLRQNQGSH
jgi:RNA polymerase sigma factor (sigma-70 family)